MFAPIETTAAVGQTPKMRFRFPHEICFQMGDVDARTKKEGRAETENQSAESSVLYKTATQKADAVSAFVNTARLTGGRATFMAGFAYYSVCMLSMWAELPNLILPPQVGRYMSSCCSSSAYIGFNLAALVLSIITAGGFLPTFIKFDGTLPVY